MIRRPKKRHVSRPRFRQMKLRRRGMPGTQRVRTASTEEVKA